METAFTRSRQKSLFQADSKGLHSALGTATHCPLEWGEQCAWAEGLAFLWVSALVSFIFLLWCEGMDSVKGKFSNLLLGNVTSKGCLWSTLLQCISLVDPCQHLAFLGRFWLTTCFPSQWSKHSWPGKGMDISSRSPPSAPKTKNKSKLLVTLQKVRTMDLFYLEVSFSMVWQKGQELIAFCSPQNKGSML